MSVLHKRGMSLKDFTYTNKDIAKEIYSAINSTQFDGISVSDFQNMAELKKAGAKQPNRRLGFSGFQIP